MKKTKLLFARCLTLLVLALLSANFAWGSQWSHSFVSPERIENNSITVSGVTWNFSTTAGVGAPTFSTGNYSSTYGLKFGSSKSIYFGSVTFTTSYFADKKVTQVKCNILNNGSKEGTLTARQGNVEFNSTSKSFGQSWNDLTVSGNGNGGDLSITYSVAQAFYLHQIVVTYENKSSETFTVTFDAGTNGTCSPTSITETSAGAGVTLPSCTPNDGYVFKGWSTTEGGSIVGVDNDTYYPSSNCTLYAVYAKTYVLTITQPTDGGTLTVKNGDTQLETGAIVEVGTNLTCEVTGIPEGKKFDQFNAKYDGGSRYRKSNPATFDNIPNNISECTISVTYEDIPKCTINYMVNGVSTGAQENVYEGTALVFPTVNDFGGKVFVGWSETAINGTTDEKPELVNISGLTATANATYYAVFATKEGEGDDKYVKVTSAPTDWSGDYLLVYEYEDNSTLKAVAWTGVDATSCGANVTFTNGEITTIPEGAATLTIATMKDGYSIKVNGGDNNGKYIDQTNYANGLAFSDNPSANTLSLDGTNTVIAGSGASGDSHVTMRYNSASDQLRFRYYKSGQQPIQLYLKHGATYSDYCTIVPPRTQDVEITTAKYATLGLPYAVTIPTGVSAYTATVSENVVTLNPIEGTTIPADCGVILKANAGKYTFTETADVNPIEDNNLVAVTAEGGINITSTNEGIYFLSTNTNGVVFKLANSGNIPQYKAYLHSAGSEAKLDVVFGDEPTGIDEVQCSKFNVQGSVFNLNGMRVNSNYKGVVIMNGKKYINK